jgi:hypothetical protein
MPAVPAPSALPALKPPRPASPVVAVSMQGPDQGTGSDTTGPAAEPAYERPEVEDLPTNEPGEKWTIPQPLILRELGINMYGWLDQGVTLNSLSPRDRWNGPVDLDDRSNDYELNQLWLGFERKVNTEDRDFDIGGRIDLMYGSDWRYGDCPGLEQSFDAQNQLYGLVLPQFYAEVGWHDLTVKLGHYAASMGYELVGAPANFFYSHSYAMSYSEIILATGMEGVYKLSPNWDLIGGWNFGNQSFDDVGGCVDFLGGFKWHSTDNKTGVSFEMSTGPDGADRNNLCLYDVVFRRELTDKLLYVAQPNLGTEQDADPRTGGYGKWYGLDQYLIYKIDSKLSVGSRVEWFRDEEGARVEGIGNLNYGWDGQPGFRGTFTETTFGLNWRAASNLVIRPEARWDFYSGTRNTDEQYPFGDGTRTQQFLLATDAVFTF